jgi:hypothetical protein
MLALPLTKVPSFLTPNHSPLTTPLLALALAFTRSFRSIFFNILCGERMFFLSSLWYNPVKLFINSLYIHRVSLKTSFGG